MTLRPIIFQPEMMLANLAGIKTQTRRLVKPQPFFLTNKSKSHSIKTMRGRSEKGDEFDGLYAYSTNSGGTWRAKCPYGQPGDQLWVRENIRAEELDNGLDGVRYLADGAFIPIEPTQEAGESWINLDHYRGKRGATVPSIHMPRWASRMLLENTGVRVERLQDISEADAMAEGIQQYKGPLRWVRFLDVITGEAVHNSARDAYAALVDSINGAGTWAANPWVWVIEFNIIEVRK